MEPGNAQPALATEPMHNSESPRRASYRGEFLKPAGWRLIDLTTLITCGSRGIGSPNSRSLSAMGTDASLAGNAVPHAAAATFPVSPIASYDTGHVLDMTGGMHPRRP